MDDDLLKMARVQLASQGGRARAKALSAKERKAIATKASKAAAESRRQKAKIDSKKSGKGTRGGDGNARAR